MTAPQPERQLLGPNSRPPVTLPWDVLEQILLACTERARFRDPTLDLEAARQLARTLQRCSLVAQDWHAYLQPLLWRELSFGSVDRPEVKSAIRSCIAHLSAEPRLASCVLAVRLATPPDHPPRHSSASQKEETDVLTALGSALIKLEGIQELTLIGPMVSQWTARRHQDVLARPTKVILTGPPSDLYLSLRNFTQVTSLHLNHPAIATPSFLGRVHDQLDNVTSLRIDHYALSPSSHPALTLLLSGEFGRHVKHLAIHLGPDCPTPSYTRTLLSLAPNVRSLSLSPQGIDLEALPALPKLKTLHLFGADQSPETTHRLLLALSASRENSGFRAHLPRLARIQTDLMLERWKSGTWKIANSGENLREQTSLLRLRKAGLKITGPETVPKDPLQLVLDEREAELAFRRRMDALQLQEDLAQRKVVADKAAFPRRMVVSIKPGAAPQSMLSSILRQTDAPKRP